MEKPTKAALDAFDKSFPEDSRAQRKKMFGLPAGFVNGYMFVGVFEHGVLFRVGEVQAEAMLGKAGIKPFEPMQGRRWPEYFHADAGTWGGRPELAQWARDALEHTAALPPKEKKAKAKPKAKR